MKIVVSVNVSLEHSSHCKLALIKSENRMAEKVILESL